MTDLLILFGVLVAWAVAIVAVVAVTASRTARQLERIADELEQARRP